MSNTTLNNEKNVTNFVKNLLPTNLQRHIFMQNKMITKNYQNFSSAKMQLQSILGLQYKQNQPVIRGQPIVLLNKQEILYYSCNFFIKFNLLTKQYHLIKKQNLSPLININYTNNIQETNNTQEKTQNQTNNGLSRIGNVNTSSQKISRNVTSAKTKLINQNNRDSLTPRVKNDQIYYMKKIIRQKINNNIINNNINNNSNNNGNNNNNFNNNEINQTNTSYKTSNLQSQNNNQSNQKHYNYLSNNNLINTILAIENGQTSINIHLLNIDQYTFKNTHNNHHNSGSSKINFTNQNGTSNGMTLTGNITKLNSNQKQTNNNNKNEDQQQKQIKNIKKTHKFSFIRIPLQNKSSIVASLSHQATKNYIYLLLSHNNSSQPIYQKMMQVQHQSLVVIDLTRQKIIMNIPIKPSSNNVILNHVISTDNHCQIYLVGKKYFRFWQLDFGQKSMKQSNIRNIQRSIKEYQVLDWIQVKNDKKVAFSSSSFKNKNDQIFRTSSSNGYKFKKGQQNTNSSKDLNYQTQKSINKECKISQSDLGNRFSTTNANDINGQNNFIDFSLNVTLGSLPSFIVLLTKKKFIFIKDNQLIGIIQPQVSISKNNMNNLGIQQDLQSSLNQIYKMKFAFQDLQNQNDNNLMSSKDRWKIQVDQILQFKCLSQCWVNSDKSFTFAVGTNQNKILLYKINSSFQIKLDTLYELNKGKQDGDQENKTHSICVSPKGEVIVCTNIPHNVAYYVNRSSYNNQQQPQMQPIWGYGHMHHQAIIGFDTPSVRNIMVSISSGQTPFTRDNISTIKLWKMNRRDRSIMIDKVYKMKVLTVSMHPCGHIFAVNFQREIKLISIVGEQFYELTSQKNIHSNQIQFSHMGHFLVSLQNGRVKFYDPFTLKTLCYIQPQDLKLSILNFRISYDDQYIFFECSDFSIMRQKIDLKAMAKTVNPSQNIKICHKQSEEYNEYYYEPCIQQDNFKFLEENQRQKNTIKNLFIGFTKSKYMVLYSNEGQNLITQFSIENDCYITDIQVLNDKKILFAGTSKGSIRAYNWPILQCHCIMEIADLKSSKIKFQPPFFTQLQVWMDKSPIKKIHKIKFSDQLVVSNQNGHIAVINFQPTKANKLNIEQVSIQRKKLMKSINDYYFARASQLQKRQKLIQKTQNDILKVQNQILRQRNLRQNHLNDQQWQIQNAFSKKNFHQRQQRNQCVMKQKIQVQKLQKQLQQRINSFEELKQKTKDSSIQKKEYEKHRNQNIQIETQQIIRTHKEKIKQQIEKHKNAIRAAKQQFQNKVKGTQSQFNKFVQEINKADRQAKNQMKQKNKFKNKGQGFFDGSDDQDQDPTVLVKFKQNLLEQDEQNQHIAQTFINSKFRHFIQKVQGLQRQICKMKHDYSDIMQKVYQMQTQDQLLQKSFQKNLQKYNQKRFENLCMHSQVLKMQNQLIQRKQILQNKDKVISMVYIQKYRLENYKELVKGQLTNIHHKKQQLYDVFIKKESDMNQIFTQLVSQIKKYDNKKLVIADLEQAKQAYLQENKTVEKKIEQQIFSLRQLKKFLLLQGSNEDNQQKKLYQQRENIQNTINWLKKRLHMAGINQKKNINLKKTSLGLVLKQNQNLLQQCNQLRSEGIQYQNQIKNLSNKLRQANNIISLETKLKNQRTIVMDQKTQLQKIKLLFDQHLTNHESNKQQAFIEKQQNELNKAFQMMNQ